MFGAFLWHFWCIFEAFLEHVWCIFGAFWGHVWGRLFLAVPGNLGQARGPGDFRTSEQDTVVGV
jgi:hypothetical protein